MFDSCHDCECLTDHTIGRSNVCLKEDGQCPCNKKYDGRTCDSCKAEYHGYPNCEPCECNTDNTKDESNVCDKVSGQCLCKEKIQGTKCDMCVDNYLLAKDIQYCKIGDKYFDLCNEDVPGNCTCHNGFIKPKDCQYCDITNARFDIKSDGQCRGKSYI